MGYKFFVYILTDWKRSILYVGVTNNLQQRIIEHYLNKGKPETFTGKYFCYFLVYYEEHKYIRNAIEREKEIKSWMRYKKEELIKSFNPNFKFLNGEIMEWPPDDTSPRGGRIDPYEDDKRCCICVKEPLKERKGFVQTLHPLESTYPHPYKTTKKPCCQMTTGLLGLLKCLA